MRPRSFTGRFAPRPRAAWAASLPLLALAACGPGTPAPEAAAPDAAPPAAAPTPGAAAPAPAEAPPAPSGAAPGPRFSARRQLHLPGKPRGLAARPAGEGPAELWVLLEDPGELLCFQAGDLERPARRLAVGGWGLGPLLLPAASGQPALAALASLAEQRLELLPLEGGGAPRHLPLLETTVDLEAGGAGEIWCLGRRGALERFVDGAPAGRWSLPIERATALALGPDGRLWVAAQTPRALLCFDPLPASGGAAEPSRRFELPEIPRDLCRLELVRGRPSLAIAAGEQALWLLDLSVPDATPRRCLAPGKVPMALAAQDLDGDGRQELLTINRYDTSYGVLGGFDPGSGDFALRATEYAGQSPFALCSADFDGDRRPDLAIANRDALAVSLLPGSGRAQLGQPVFYQALRLPVGTNPLGCLLVDLDGDGPPEALSLDSSAGRATRFLNRFGRLVEPRSVPVGPSPRRAAAIDWDGDGDRDVAVLLEPTSGSLLTVLLGDGAGGLEAAAEPWPAGRASALCGFGQGADRGLALADGSAARLGLWRPGARELHWTDLPAPPVALVPAQGGLWIAAGGEQPALLWVRGPDGAGRFSIEQRTPLPHAPIDLAWLETRAGPRLALLAALSNDAKEARLFVCAPGPEPRWLPGPRVGQKPIQIAAGDLDGDGHADLALAAQNQHAIELYPWRGDAQGFGRWPDLGAGLGCFALALGDLDGDARLDVLAANAFSHDLSAIYALAPR
jgi:hypothetical protein